MRLAILIATIALSNSGCASTASKQASDGDTAADPRAISGIVLLDGAVNGCGGEQITVQVRDATSVVGSELVDSSFEGFDCLYRFNVEVPELPCYQLMIDRQPVGRYSAETLDDSGNVGIIPAKSVWGDPETGEEPRLYADFNGC